LIDRLIYFTIVKRKRPERPYIIAVKKKEKTAVKIKNKHK